MNPRCSLQFLQSSCQSEAVLHQGTRSEDRLMQTEISARSQRIYNGISLFIIISVFVSPSWYPETLEAESLYQILLGEVGGLG